MMRLRSAGHLRVDIDRRIVASTAWRRVRATARGCPLPSTVYGDGGVRSSIQNTALVSRRVNIGRLKSAGEPNEV